MPESPTPESAMSEKTFATAPIRLQHLYQARQRTAAFVRRTPLLHSPALSAQAGSPCYLKLDMLQDTGAFKLRGASNKLLSLSPEQRSRGVVTASTGNHGRAVAHVAKQLGIPAIVCVSRHVAANKLEPIRALGADLRNHYASQDEAESQAYALAAAEGLVAVSPFDDPDVIAGQGTMGLEMLEQHPELRCAIVPLSGGGLISGVALALKTANPAIRVIGVSMERAPVMYHSLQAGKPVAMPEEDTLADSLRGGIGLDNRYTFAMVQRYVDDVVLVSEEAIAQAMAFLFREHGLVSEGGAAVGVAALLQQQVQQGGDTVVVTCGRNVAMGLFLRTVQPWLEQHRQS